MASPLYYKITAVNELGESVETTGSYTPVAPTAAAHHATHEHGGADALTGLLDASVAKVKESGGTTLNVGSVPDGKLLQRSGTNIIGVDPPSTLPSPRTITTIIANTTLTGAHYIVLVDTDAAGTDVTVTLLSAAVAKEYTIKNIGTGIHRAIIDGNGSQTIDGSLTVELASGDKLTIAANTAASNWQSV